ncbi:MAG TPA: serine/threonine protein phosphatase, partial [Mitsuokella multacida]|nr:serine/threonine protein phosphatase [Mitsuokella multacida]
KFYNLIPQQQDYIAARSQNWRPTYSVVHITKNEFSIITYDAETGTPIDQSYSIVKD